MKPISTSAATALLLACSVALGAQTSSANKPSSPTSTQGSAAQTGSATRDTQTTTPPSGSTTGEKSTPAPQRRAARSTRSATPANPPQEVTLTGCLQSGDQSGASASTATTGTSATRRAQSNAAPTFILSSAGAGSTPSSFERSVGTTGNQSTSSSSASLSGAAGSYILQGLDLSRQVGQQVEITGTAVPASQGRNARSRATGTSGSSPDASSSMQRIRVISARMVSEHCSNQ